MEEESEKIAVLLNSLAHPDKKVIRRAADALISMAPGLPELPDRLGRLLSNLPADKSWPIAYVLAHISSPSPSCLHVLRETLGSRDPDIRWAVSLLLVRLGKNNREIVSLLLDLLKSGTPTQRRMALYCLRDLDFRDEVSLRAIVESLRDPDPLVRVAAVTSLKTREEIGQDGMEILLQLFLADSDSRVRCNAAVMLAQLGAPNENIRRALEEAGRSEEPQLKKAADAALALLKKRGPAPTAK